MGCDRRASLTEHLRARAPAPLPRRTRTPQAAGDAPAALSPTFIQQRTAFLEASMASLRTRAATLTATVSSLVTQRNDLLTNLQGTQQSVNALFTTPSSRTPTAPHRVKHADLGLPSHPDPSVRAATRRRSSDACGGVAFRSHAAQRPNSRR